MHFEVVTKVTLGDPVLTSIQGKVLICKEIGPLERR